MYKLFASSLIFVFLLSCCTESDIKTEKQTRTIKWAQPMQLDGVPNLHKVTDDLYRGAQPDKEGVKALKEIGIKTVVNLRSFNSDRSELGDTGLSYEHIYMKAWHAEEKEVVRFLKIMANKERSPVFVHCQHGADRTGTMCAIYRIVFCGFTKDEAIQEMIEGGFGYHTIWDNLPRFIRKLDIEDIKNQAGL